MKNESIKQKLSSSLQRTLLLTSLLVAGLFTTVACSSSNDDPGQPDPEVPEGNLTPKPGMDLWGVITTADGKGIKDVVVSDGFSCVQTDDKGMYQMKKNETAMHVYYSTPAEYKIITAGASNQMANFYQELAVSKARYDFRLEKLPAVENDYTLLVIADPQVKNNAEITRFEKEIVSDVKLTIKANALPMYGLVMGDIMDTDKAVLSPMRRVMGDIGVPMFTTIGNHDKLKGASASEPRDANLFMKTYGPLNYSFNRGKVHFVCLDNNRYSNADTYTGGFTDEQVKWLEQDLKSVPSDQMLIFYYHIPLRDTKYANRDAILKQFSRFSEVHLMCGHTHYNENYMVKAPIQVQEHIHAAACGAWWHSVVNGDGTPNGYAIYEVKGNKITDWHYKAAQYDKSFQMRLHRGDGSFGGDHGYYAFGQPSDVVVANVWNADPQWKIEIYEDGVSKGAMKSWNFNQDSWAKGYHIGVVGRNEKNYSQPTKHLFTHKLSNPNAKVKVVATDRFGNKYEQSEIITDLTTAGAYK